MECSVLLTVYNGEAKLAEAIESILNQTERDFEFIIIDDKSKDHSKQIISEYAKKDSRIRPLFHERNMGLAKSLNEGLALASTDLIARMDQDDISLPSRLKLQVRFMRTRPEIAAAGSFVYHMGRTPKLDRLVRLPAEHDEIVQVLPRQNCMYHPSIMLRRQVVLELGGYREEFRNAEDYDLWLRLSQKHRLANLQLPLLRYRFSAGGMSLGKRWEQMRYVQMAQVSYRDSSLAGPDLERAADNALEQVDRHEYFDIVAKGTLTEMIRLGDLRGATVALRAFTRTVTRPHARTLVRYAVGTLIRHYFDKSNDHG
jgi:glycosyltransferase involved in cell wall biosynthesis